ncbi:MAG: rRNA maturation RNase YbeY [Opitutales bacterium]
MPSPRRVSVNNAHPALKFRQADVKALFRFLDEGLTGDAVPAGELSVAFVDAGEIIRLHESFLDDPTITDVITFPGDKDENLAGEICVCADYAAQQAPKFGQSLSEELTLYLVHGWLHLAAYDDKAEPDRASMREAEARTMAAVRKADKLPGFALK